MMGKDKDFPCLLSPGMYYIVFFLRCIFPLESVREKR